MTEKRSQLYLNDLRFGDFVVSGVRFFKCPRCGELLLPPKTLDAIEEKRNILLQEYIRSLPFDDFISSTEAAALLNISRQALHKHRRIRRGFIYSTIGTDGKIRYVKTSVLMYRDTGDGRYPLRTSTLKVVEYEENETGFFTYPLFCHPAIAAQPKLGWSQLTSSLTKSIQQYDILLKPSWIFSTFDEKEEVHARAQTN
jgi:hypothetical protein